MEEQLFGLIGRKLGHSFSVPIHVRLGNPSYRLIELEPDELAGFMGKELIGGLNITIPYKQDVMKLCDAVSPEARAIGAVNTVVKTGDLLYGYNTDKYGFEYMLRRAGIELSGKKVLVLGSGGASHTAAFSARALGAAQVIIISRNGADNYGNLEKHSDADIIMNATPVGMYPDNLVSPVSLRVFKKCSGVIDVIYNPIRTKLIMEAEQMGIPHTGGLSMLTAQAKAAEELFFKKSISDAMIELITGKLLRENQNIVLIGMPGSGKSAVGAELSRITGRSTADTDAIVEAAAGKSIPRIFADDGEPVFRQMESEAIYAAGKELGKIIITGGGAVLDPENYAPLRQNGRIYHIRRELSQLAMTGRPLSSDETALREMYEKRRRLYEHFRDAAVDNISTVYDLAQEIWRDFYENTCA